MHTPFDIVPEDDNGPDAGDRDEAIGGVLSILLLVVTLYGLAFVFQDLAGLA